MPDKKYKPSSIFTIIARSLCEHPFKSKVFYPALDPILWGFFYMPLGAGFSRSEDIL
jgi:hypothetical protein